MKRTAFYALQSGIAKNRPHDNIYSMFQRYRQVFTPINAANIQLFADTGKFLGNFFVIADCV